MYTPEMVFGLPLGSYVGCVYLLYMSLYAGEDVLPVDPSLSSTIAATLPSLTFNQDLSTDDSQVEVTKQPPSVVLSKGLPPITTKLLDKMQRWEFVDLSSLLSCDPTIKSDTVALTHEGQHLLVVNPQSQFNHHKKQITDLPTWIKALSLFM